MRTSLPMPARLLLAAVVLTLMAVTPPGHSTDASGRLAVHRAPVRWKAAAARHGTEPITFHGGAVMTGAVRVHVVWYGSWPKGSRRRRIVTDFLSHLASPWWDINRTYPSKSGRLVTATPALGAQADDPGSVGTRQLSDEQILQVVQRAVVGGALPRDPKGIYLVLTSKDVTKAGFLTEYCGWHSHAVIGGSTVKFAFIGDPTGPRIAGCSARFPGPNGDPGADSMVSTIAHELAETVTDPTFRGWRTASGEENADRCAFEFGPTHTAGRGNANVRIGGRDWLIQTNWVNDGRPRCAAHP